MVSFVARSTPSIAAATLLVAAVVATADSVAQATVERFAQDDPELALIDAIQAEEDQRGVNSPALVELLTDLSLRYEDSEDRELAMATIQRALEVIRVNEGLYSLAQSALLQRLIRLEEARGDAKAAWGIEQDLLALARRDPEDARAAQVFRAAGERRLRFLDRYMAGGATPEIVLGCYYQVGRFIERDRIPYGTCQSGSRRVAIDNIRADAAQLYGAAGDVAEQRELERQLPTDWPRVIR